MICVFILGTENLVNFKVVRKCNNTNLDKSKSIFGTRNYENVYSAND